MPRREMSRRRFLTQTALYRRRRSAVPTGRARRGYRSQAHSRRPSDPGQDRHQAQPGSGSDAAATVARSSAIWARTDSHRLIRYAYDQGITYLDTAQSYNTHEMIGKAIKGLPREKLFIQSKMGGTPEKPLDLIDPLPEGTGDRVYRHPASPLHRHARLGREAQAHPRRFGGGQGQRHDPCPRRVLSQPPGPEARRRAGLGRRPPGSPEPLRGPGSIRPKRRGTPRAIRQHVPAVMEQMKLMQAKGRGVIGMKLIGKRRLRQSRRSRKGDPLRDAIQLDQCRDHRVQEHRRDRRGDHENQQRLGGPSAQRRVTHSVGCCASFGRTPTAGGAVSSYEWNPDQIRL